MESGGYISSGTSLMCHSSVPSFCLGLGTLKKFCMSIASGLIGASPSLMQRRNVCKSQNRFKVYAPPPHENIQTDHKPVLGTSHHRAQYKTASVPHCTKRMCKTW